MNRSNRRPGLRGYHDFVLTLDLIGRHIHINRRKELTELVRVTRIKRDWRTV